MQFDDRIHNLGDYGAYIETKTSEANSHGDLNALSHYTSRMQFFASKKKNFLNLDIQIYT
jgi:hypothetical protein